jgi:D-3-phosphoglycerate dehydrogenase
VAALNVKPLTQAAITGLLRPQLENVNMVNAPLVARERGIDVAEVKHDRDSDYQTQITITVTTERRTRSVSGTLFGGKHPRLVNIKGIEIEAEFAPRMLYITNDDKPGFIGRLGALLGDAGVNIATFHLGRDKPGGEAIALVAVDQTLDPALVERISSLPGVTQAKALAF